MASSSSSIDLNATQHLRDILKLDRQDDSESENQRKPSAFNGDLNGLLIPDPVEAHALLPESCVKTAPIVNILDRQVICLTGDDSSSIEITGKDVEIVASSDSNICSKARGSNKVKIQPVAKYDWEQKYYYGNLIAVSNSYLAYATRGANGLAMVRVLSVTTAERILLKGIKGTVSDLAFAHLNSNQLACLDEAGNLFVWRLTMENGKIQDEILVHLQRPDDTPLNNLRRIIWCPYIPEENEDASQEDASQTIALLHEDRAEVWDLEIVRGNHSTWPTEIIDVKEGFIVVKGHSGHLSEGALSPDGTVLATASHDGYVKFWQIYIEGQDQPRCLHEWKPHNGRPLSCLLFCDNHKKQDPEVPFWRFLITGADQNRELKMWCTVSWTCLQTIRFSPDPFTSSVLPGLKATLDLSSEFLILTDVQRKVLYVMELMQNQDDGKASFTSISEFLLTHPVLSFGIQDVSRCRLRHTEVLPSEEENDSINAEESMEPETDESANGVLIKLFCVHTKALQDVQIWFQPRQSLELGATLTQDSHSQDFAMPSQMASRSQERQPSSQNVLQDSQVDLRRITTDFLLFPADTKPILMTPDAFMTTSTSFHQITSSPGGSCITTLTSVTPISMVSMNETVMSRPSEELSPKLLENMTLSNASSSGGIQASSQNSSVLITGLSEKVSPKVQVTQSSLPLELQGLEPLGIPQASPTRERSPDVISSASTAISQGIPEIASETLQRSYPSQLPSGLSPEAAAAPDHTDSMSSAASALHLLSPRNCPTSEHVLRPLEVRPFGVENERIGAPSLPDNTTAHNNTNDDSLVPQPWPAAPDITRETRNNLVESVRDDQERANASFHRHSYHFIQQHDSQDASAEQSDHDDEVASLASTSFGVGGKGPSQRLPVKDWKAKLSPRSSPKLRRKSKKDDGDLSQSPRLSENQASSEQQGELIALLRNQQREISDLRQNQLDLIQRLTDHMDSVQSSIMGHVERVIDSQQEQEQRRLDQILSDGQQRNGQLQEYLSQQLAQSLSGALCNRLDKTLREEIKKTVPPSISKVLEPVTGQLSSTIAAKLTAVEGILKENITKMVKSKHIVVFVSRTSDVPNGVMEANYKNNSPNAVFSIFQRKKFTPTHFRVICTTVRQATKKNKYIHQIETHLKNKKAQEHETHDPLVIQLQQLIDCLQTTTDQLSTNLVGSVRTEVQHQLHEALIHKLGMQDSILTQVQRIIKEEVSHAMKEQQAAVTTSIMQAMRSAAGTPIPSSHLDFQSQQAHILQLMQQGHINQAFQQALTASDLNLILYVCDTVDPQQVFGQEPCPLTQPVLLSLIQQLSFDLGTRTDLKLK
ncbi:enhancer of mRNA-decapping 4 isoform X1 [Pelobates cultripes]|uniref:Enhancer of mRNA-decapping protein 4 n=1 Tax=Pelobates cultripes TaxID=61616 RepID=A0AAD1WQY8_PELCU|nr:enhancer of mRNA-decapping 4 isoform X1 [Pelobates cultripes]